MVSVNKWLKYLKDKLLEESNVVIQLLLIDNKIQGTKMDINYFINFINSHINTRYFYFVDESSFLIEGNPLSLIKVINDNINDDGERIVINENNVAINRWLIEKYYEYIEENGIDARLNISISNHYDFSDSKKLLIIGSLAFLDELRDNINISHDTLVDE